MFNSKKCLLIASLFLIITISSVTALEVKKTEFVIATEPYQNLSIRLLNSESSDKEEVGLFEGRARKFGEYRFTYYGTINKVILVASAINNETGDTLKKEEFGPYSLGTPIINLNFSVSESPSENKENIIENNYTNSTIESPKVKKNPLIGLVIGENGEFSKIYYYVGAGALGIIILIIIFKRGIKTNSAPSEPNPKKLKVVKKPEKTEIVVQAQQKSDDTIEQTEKKIADLQKQLEQIRSEEKLLKLQKQINEEKQSLRKMQEEENPQKQEQQNTNNFNKKV